MNRKQKKFEKLTGLVVPMLFCLFSFAALAAQLNFNYDAIGQLTGITYENGVRVTYTYDALGNRTNKTVVVPPTLDTDGDGVFNVSDACPFSPNDAIGDPCNHLDCADLSSQGSGGTCSFSNSNAVTMPLGGRRGSDDGAGINAQLSYPTGICLSPDGSQMFITGEDTNIIRQVNRTTLAVTTLAGSANQLGDADGTGSGARFYRPQTCVVDPTGTTLYLSENLRHTIRKVVISTGVVTTIAGSAGSTGTTDGTGTSARFNAPLGITIDRAGENLYVADSSNFAIRKINLSTLAVTLLAGTIGVSGSADGTGTAASFNRPRHLLIDSTDTYLYMTEGGNGRNNVIRRITMATGEVKTIAGSGAYTFLDGTGIQATFRQPTGIVIDPSDSFLYVADTINHAIRKIVIATGVVTTISGTGSIGNVNGTGTGATFNAPWGMAITPDGSKLYIIDSSNHLIRLLQ